ncbi:energy transducer TonB [Lysobacter korlensis]|uniref:Protein TonB n=1 Tax=Lysobacter korlensis TaxID=553636 RepID=A0ABV6RPS8_9GAMM
MAQTLFFPTRSIRSARALDATRIGAGCGAIALNALVMLLLLVPIAPRIADEAPRDELEVVEIRRLEPRPVPPPEPQPVETRPTQSSPVPDPRPRIAVPAFETTPAAIGDIHAEIGDVEGVPPADAVQESGGTGDLPTAGAALRALTAPPPPYPRDALRKRLQGTVVLDVHVDIDGNPVEVAVATSSGHHALDRAAQRHVQRAWRFQPAMRDGRAVPALGRVPVAFVLEH